MSEPAAVAAELKAHLPADYDSYTDQQKAVTLGFTMAERYCSGFRRVYLDTGVDGLAVQVYEPIESEEYPEFWSWYKSQLQPPTLDNSKRLTGYAGECGILALVAEKLDVELEPANTDDRYAPDFIAPNGSIVEVKRQGIPLSSAHRDGVLYGSHRHKSKEYAPDTVCVSIWACGSVTWCQVPTPSEWLPVKFKGNSETQARIPNKYWKQLRLGSERSLNRLRNALT